MQTPPRPERPERPAPGAPRQRRQGYVTPRGQGIQRRIPGAPRRRPREDGGVEESKDSEEAQEEYERNIRVAADEENETPLHKNPQTDGLIVNNLKF